MVACQLPSFSPRNLLLSFFLLPADLIAQFQKILPQRFNTDYLIAQNYAFFCQFLASVVEQVQNLIALFDNFSQIFDSQCKSFPKLDDLVFFIIFDHDLQLWEGFVMVVPQVGDLLYFLHNFLFFEVHV